MSLDSSAWTREGIAWAAGLFEGEGCIRNNTLTVAMTDKDVLESFARAVGGGGITPRKTSSNRFGKKQQWEWRVHKQEYMQALLAAMWPWLGERRRARAVEMIENMKTGYLRRINRGSKNGNAKLTEDNVREILVSKERPSSLAKKYSVALTNIRDIQLRRTWRHINVVL